MKNSPLKDSSEILSEVIIEGIREKKGSDILCLDLRDIHHSVCDYFIICHGDSSTQVDAIARSVEEFTEKNLEESPWHKEGFENTEWILLDYFNVVVHIFHRDVRSFYNLEGLWADAKVTEIDYIK